MEVFQNVHNGWWVSSDFTLILPLPEDCQMLLRLGSWVLFYLLPGLVSETVTLTCCVYLFSRCPYEQLHLFREIWIS